MPFVFPRDDSPSPVAGAVRVNEGGNSFHVPVVIYGPDGVTPVSSSQRLPVDALVAGGQTLRTGVVRVTSAGTRVRLHTNLACREVTVIGLPENEGRIYVGDNTVSATSFGVSLAAEGGYTFPVSNLNMVWLDAETGGEGVSYVAVL